MALDLKSTAFDSGESIPTKYTCDGANVSPPLQWSGVPDNAQSLVLICEDPDAPGRTFSHWVLYNIPPTTTALSEGDESGTPGNNDFGKSGYGGPCPPRGPAHRYYFRLYALDGDIEVVSGATRPQVLDSIEGHILAEAEWMGRYERT